MTASGAQPVISGSAEYQRSRTLRRHGILVLALFAILWAVVGASGLPPDLASGARITGVIISAAIIVVALRPGRPMAERRRNQPDGWYGRVGLINLVQAAAIALVVLGFITAQLPQLVPPVVSVIVGLHFFPLARLFDQPQYLWTAAGACAAGIAGLLLIAGAGFETSRIAVGLGAALTLWLTTVWLALRP
ncbi:DUF7010 family protein [Arthrobacter pigmenti]